MAGDGIDQEMNKIKSDISDLRADMASLINALRDAGIEQGRQTYERAYERARHTGETVRSRTDEAYGMLGKEIEEHPLTSVLAAFGTGFVVGMLLDRRHHH